MKKKFLGVLLTCAVICSCLVGCGNKTNTATPSDATKTSEVTSTDAAKTNELTYETLNAAIQKQFSDLDAEKAEFTMTGYLGEDSTEFPDSSLYMRMSKTKDNKYYAYMAGYTECWVVDDTTVYYYNETDGNWYKDAYTEDMQLTANSTLQDISEEVLPADTVIGKTTINGLNYITATFTDADGVEATYLFHKDGQDYLFDGVTGKDESTNMYMLVTIELSAWEFDEDILNAEEGNYTDYMVNKMSSTTYNEDDTEYEDNTESENNTEYEESVNESDSNEE